ncbi:MAG: AmmeMemoRadiSam system radical SAM enzyme [Kiritimatiellaeota bacterium]|nr:AmmeMemoRadiSam system radical SAM enzyme [Kiritimatiellota bacterium]
MAKFGIGLEVLPAVASVAWVRDRVASSGETEAAFYRKLPDNRVACLLCPRLETLKPGETGFCRVRTNRGGVLQTAATGRPCVVNLDPIEKGPLNHVLPGTAVFAMAHAGCNLRCRYCQNWQFAQASPSTTRNLRFDQMESVRLVREKALAGVCFTYTEGVVHLEFNLRFAAAVREAGARAFLCTAGFVNRKPFADFLDQLDAVTFTIKGATDRFYRDVIGAPSVRPVLERCVQARQAGKWVEVATLVVPEMNDSDRDLRRIARWIGRNLGRDTPWHIERFMPKYKMRDRPRTPIATLERAREIGREEGLNFVYLSNLAPHPGNHTYCPQCGKAVIKRLGFRLLANRLKHGCCPYCRARIPGVWG